MSDKESTPQNGWFQKGNRKVIALATGTVIVISSAFGVQALAHSKTYAHMQLYAGDIGGWHRDGWRGGHHGRFSEMSDAEIEAKIERMVKHVAIEIEATAEQQEKITTLVNMVAKDLKPVHEQMRAAGKEIHDLLMADTIDRTALEQLRADQLAEADRISKSLVNAVADVAEVLTAEQRNVLDERIKQFRFMGKGMHRG